MCRVAAGQQTRPMHRMRVSGPFSLCLLCSTVLVHPLSVPPPDPPPPCRAPTTSSASSRSVPRATRSWTPPWLTSSTPAACMPASAGGLLGGWRVVCVCVRMGGGGAHGSAGWRQSQDCLRSSRHPMSPTCITRVCVCVLTVLLLRLTVCCLRCPAALVHQFVLSPYTTNTAAPASAAAVTATSWRAGSWSSTSGRCRRRRRAQQLHKQAGSMLAAASRCASRCSSISST